jgi:AcrR family transcriptional regulator
MAPAMRKAFVSRTPEQVVARILDAAEAEFMAVGYESASTNAIAARFAGSKATLFRHFPTKLQLLEAVIRRIASRWPDRFAVDELTGGDPAAWLTDFTLRCLEWFLSDELLFLGRLKIAEGYRTPELDPVFDDVVGAPLHALLADQLQSWTRAGILDCPSPLVDAELFLDLALSGRVSRALYSRTRPDPASLAAHAARVTGLFLSGRALRPAR